MANDSNFGDPRFQPPAFSESDIMRSFVALAAHKPILHPEHGAWLVPFFQEGDAANVGHDKIMKMVRDAGRVLDRSELAQRGIDTRRTITAEMADLLTPLGISQIDDAWDAIIGAPFRHRFWRREQAKVGPDYPFMRFTAITDNNTCAAAKARHGEVVAAADAAALPLADCDKLGCRCHHMALSQRMADRYRTAG